MGFNPGSSKEAQEITFSRNTKKIYHPSLRFNNSIASQIPYQKHLGTFIDAWLIFEEHLKLVTTKVDKTIGMYLEFILYNTCLALSGAIRASS